MRIGDDFHCKCRMLTKSGKQCTRNASWIVNVTDRDSWLEALRSGWPMMVKGMKSPQYSGKGLCNQHHIIWSKNEHNKIPNKLICGTYAYPKLDKEYDDAVKEQQFKRFN